MSWINLYKINGSILYNHIKTNWCNWENVFQKQFLSICFYKLWAHWRGFAGTELHTALFSPLSLKAKFTNHNIHIRLNKKDEFSQCLQTLKDRTVHRKDWKGLQKCSTSFFIWNVGYCMCDKCRFLLKKLDNNLV